MQLLSVSNLNTYLHELINADIVLQDIWIEGEVFDFKPAASGHWYLSLKEGDSTIGAACWRTFVARIGHRPHNGETVLAHGRIDFYEKTGRLQLIIDMLRPSGVGILQARFEELVVRLTAEGLFDESRKRQLPLLPQRIGVVTSPTGAVIRDIITVLGRRYPLAELVVAPAKVQGEGAADTIVEALYTLYDAAVDVIIVARGGGSSEDLWCFNEEIVARAVFASPVPVISAVGHETDVTIIDFVADLRAPTPSAAAELVAPSLDGLQAAASDLAAQMTQTLREHLRSRQDDLADLGRRLDALSPLGAIGRDRQRIDELLYRASAQLGHQVSLRRARLEGSNAQLAALSPSATLERGYAVVRKATGSVVTAPNQVAPGESLQITVSGGTFGASSSATS